MVRLALPTLTLLCMSRSAFVESVSSVEDGERWLRLSKQRLDLFGFNLDDIILRPLPDGGPLLMRVDGVSGLPFGFQTSYIFQITCRLGRPLSVCVGCYVLASKNLNVISL